jgi:hypothetical protein
MAPAGEPVGNEGAALGTRDVSYICLVTLVLIVRRYHQYTRQPFANYYPFTSYSHSCMIIY